MSALACRPLGRQQRTPTPEQTPHVSAPQQVPKGERVVVAAAGDIAGRGNQQAATAKLLGTLIAKRSVKAVLLVGDLQYPSGEYEDFLRYYHPTWGKPQIRELTRPVPGNHEYNSGAYGYFDYFNGVGKDTGPAGVRDAGYYSFDMGDWHFIALNTSDGCGAVSCEPTSPMRRWLAKDLADNDRDCTLAYYHHPRFQQGARHADSEGVAPVWNVLYDAGVDIVIGGHEHNFQALAPLNKAGQRDGKRGIRSFVVGTGGARPYQDFEKTLHRGNVDAKIAGRYGVLLLTLESEKYIWEFVATDETPDGEVLVQGSDVCR
ncbi:MAG TPA: metallophosphoesterase [Polyangiaceae bacterium]|nr:metallophosphoesterase [Polyangiaceae bacterium]